MLNLVCTWAKFTGLLLLLIIIGIPGRLMVILGTRLVGNHNYGFYNYLDFAINDIRKSVIENIYI